MSRTASALIIVAAVLVGVLGTTVWQKVTTWSPSADTQPIIFLTGGEKPVGVISLQPNGVLQIDVKEMYKQLQVQEKTAKANPQPQQPKK